MLYFCFTVFSCIPEPLPFRGHLESSFYFPGGGRFPPVPALTLSVVGRAGTVLGQEVGRPPALGLGEQVDVASPRSPGAGPGGPRAVAARVRRRRQIEAPLRLRQGRRGGRAHGLLLASGSRRGRRAQQLRLRTGRRGGRAGAQSPEHVRRAPESRARRGGGRGGGGNGVPGVSRTSGSAAGRPAPHGESRWALREVGARARAQGAPARGQGRPGGRVRTCVARAPGPPHPDSPTGAGRRAGPRPQGVARDGSSWAPSLHR